MKPTVFFVVVAIALSATTGATLPPTQETLQPSSIIVTSTADWGPGTLREALSQAPSGAFITFDPALFPPDDPTTIFILSALPELAQGQLTIDGSNAGIILDGSQAPRPEPVTGLVVASRGNVIQGLQILHFSGGGIIIARGAQDNTIGGDRTTGTGPSGQGNVISGNGETGVAILGAGTGNNVVSGNYIGTDISGSFAIPNLRGVVISDGAAENIVGGNEEGEANVISGNEIDGLVIAGAATVGNKVTGNHIGISATGTVAIGNGACGVWLGEGTRHNIIGGGNPAERNVISGGKENGVVIDGSTHNTISGNFIGTDASGTASLGNGNIGVVLAWGAQYNLVGGATPEERNLISGSGNVGVSIADTDTMSNTVSGNYIGTDVTGTRALGNVEAGVWIGNSAQYNTVGGTTPEERNLISGNHGGGVVITDARTMWNVVRGNYIGTDFMGVVALGNADDGVFIRAGAGQNSIGPGNVIAHNGSEGVAVRGPETLGNLISANAIHDNEGAGIRSLDGGNAGLPPPLITHVGTRIIRGTAPPNSIIEVFSDEGDEARVFEGTVSTDGEGNFTYRVPQGRFTGPNVTASARDGEGNTSGLSTPESPPSPVAMRELPGIVGPAQVSLDPKTVGTNLGLALFCVLFFGLTSNIFNTILKDYRDDLLAAGGRMVPRAFPGYIRKDRPVCWRDDAVWSRPARSDLAGCAPRDLDHRVFPGRAGRSPGA